MLYMQYLTFMRDRLDKPLNLTSKARVGQMDYKQMIGQKKTYKKKGSNMVTTNNMLLSYKDERFVMCSKKKKWQ